MAKPTAKKAAVKPKLSNVSTPPKMRIVTRRLKELEEEKVKLEQMIHDLTALREREKQREQRAAALTAQAAAAAGVTLPVPKEPKKPKPVVKDEYDYDENDAQQQSEVSSLRSVGVSRMGNSSSDESPIPERKRTFDSDDVSVMTEDIYHYDVRGRRVTDDDYVMEDTETIAACYQQITGRSTNSNESTAHNNQKKNTKSNKSNSQDTQQPRVMIEWKRGRSYKPEANLAFDHSELYNHHPTDLSLMVKDDMSFFDDLSLSSGDDPILAAAITDMPMEIDLMSNGSDESVNSGLHSECSVSVAAAPYEQQIISNNNKSSKQPSHNKAGNTANGFALQHSSLQNPNQFLYQRNLSLDVSDDSHDRHNAAAGGAMNDASRKSTSSRRRRRPGNDNTGSPPPLTTDMSLVDGQQNGNHNNIRQGNNVTDLPPIEISFSELSLNSVDSLGSEMGGVSQAPDQKAPPPVSNAKPTKTHNGKAKTMTPESNAIQNGNSNNNNANTVQSRKTKKKISKAKGSLRAQPPQPYKESPGPADEMLLGDRDSETEENELSTGDLAFSVHEKDEAKIVAANNNPQSKAGAMAKNNGKNSHTTVTPNGKATSAKHTQLSSVATASKKRAPQQQQNAAAYVVNSSSASTLGDHTGIDTEACVAAPRRASVGAVTPPRKKNSSNTSNNPPGRLTPTGGKAKRKEGGTGVKPASDKFIRQSSNSTCNSSLTSLPGVLDGSNARALVIDGGP
jgi:hypothetical protein